MFLENPRSREQPSKNSLVSFGGKTKKKKEGREQEWGATLKKKKGNQSDLLCFRKCHLSTCVCFTAIDLEVR